MSVSSTDQVKSLRLLDIANLYNNIRPGDTTHEDIHLTYNEYFVKFGRRMKVFVQTPNDEILQQFPCFVLQVSYDQCIRCILYGEVMERFRKNLPNFEIPDQLIPFYQSDVKRYSTGNKQNIGQIFKFTPWISESYKEDWELLKARYGCLLHISEARSYQPFNVLVNEVLDILPVCEGLSEEKVKTMVDKAVHLAWDMVTLVPPALICQPSQYHEEWHEKRITYWKEESTPHPLIYIRPVLFFSALGHVGCKGIIGNSITADMKIVHCTYSNDIKLSSSELSLQVIETDVNTSSTSLLLDETKDNDSIEELNSNANGSITLLSDECSEKHITTEKALFVEQSVSTSINATPNNNRDSVNEEELLSTRNSDKDRYEERFNSEDFYITERSTECLKPPVNFNDISQPEDPRYTKHVNTTTAEEPPIHKANDWSIMRPESIHQPVTKPAYIEEGRVCTIASEAPVSLDSTADLLKNKLQLLEIANLYNNTAPGTPTHEDIMSLFKEYFVKFSRHIKVFVKSSTNGIMQQFPCFVLQVAYEQCHNYVINQLLVILKPSLSQLGLELSSIDKMFSFMSSIDEEDWELLKAQYGFLLYLSQASSRQPFLAITNKVLDILPVCEGLSEDTFKLIVDKAVHLAWDMVTLVPPAVVCQPSWYHEEWHEKSITYWSENSSPHPLIYIRPVLFSSALGHVGCKGIIGNSTTRYMKIVHCIGTMSNTKESDNGIISVNGSTNSVSTNDKVDSLLSSSNEVSLNDSHDIQKTNEFINVDLIEEQNVLTINLTGQLSHEEKVQPQLSFEEESSDDTTEDIVHASTTSIYDHLIDVNEASLSLWRNMPDYEDSETLLRDCSQCNKVQLVSCTSNTWICEECYEIVHIRHETRTRRRRWWFIACFHPQTN